MSIVQTAIKIAVQAPVMFCDSCGVGFVPLYGIGPLQIRRLHDCMEVETPAEVPYVFYLEQTSKTMSLIFDAARSRGWRQETIHGKQMDFCPVCSAKT